MCICLIVFHPMANVLIHICTYMQIVGVREREKEKERKRERESIEYVCVSEKFTHIVYHFPLEDCLTVTI